MSQTSKRCSAAAYNNRPAHISWPSKRLRCMISNLITTIRSIWRIKWLRHSVNHPDKAGKRSRNLASKPLSPHKNKSVGRKRSTKVTLSQSQLKRKSLRYSLKPQLLAHLIRLPSQINWQRPCKLWLAPLPQWLQSLSSVSRSPRSRQRRTRYGSLFCAAFVSSFRTQSQLSWCTARSLTNQ